MDIKNQYLIVCASKYPDMIFFVRSECVLVNFREMHAIGFYHSAIVAVGRERRIGDEALVMGYPASRLLS